MISTVKLKILGSILLALPLLLHSAECQAVILKTAPDSLIFSLNFRQGSALLMKDYRDNSKVFEEMSAVLAEENAAKISKITIIGSTSPEGVVEFNHLLAAKRAEAVHSYIIWRWGFKKEAIEMAGRSDNLSAWLEIVTNDINVPRRDKVLEILNSNSSLPTMWANIQLLKGDAASYMEQNIFPKLRNAVSLVVRFEPTAPAPKTEAPKVQDVVNNTIVAPKDVEKETEVEVEKAVEPANYPIKQAINQTIQIERENKPLFALKTNLLFDAATLLNLEVEVPIGNHWSIAGELIFPWWLWENKQTCIQIMSGTVEGRYWFGNRSERSKLTGWFAGVHVGGGYYDLEYKRKGYQGEFFLAAGVSGGYAHTINKRGNLRMEYSLGVGYLSTNYRFYDAEYSDVDNSWHLYRASSGRFSWFGPTRAKVSLVWLIDTNLFRKKGGHK